MHEEDIRYIYEERLGIICGDNQPTFKQKNIAKTEAIRYCESAGMSTKQAISFCIRALKNK